MIEYSAVALCASIALCTGATILRATLAASCTLAKAHLLTWNTNISL